MTHGRRRGRRRRPGGRPSTVSGERGRRSTWTSTCRPVVVAIRGCGQVGAGRRAGGASPPARPARRAYTWTSSRPSPGWPRGTRSAPSKNWPLAITTVVAGPSCTRAAVDGRRGRRRGRCQARSAAGCAARAPRGSPRCPPVGRRARRSGSAMPAARSPAGAAAMPDGAGEVGAGRARNRTSGTASASARHDARRARRRRPCTSTSGVGVGGLAPRLPRLDHGPVTARRSTRRRRRGSTRRRPRRRWRAVSALGAATRDLAQQVDHLLHVADEVAAGELVVLVEDVGERVAARPGVHRVGEPGIGRPGLGQPGVVLVGAQVLPDAARAPGCACATRLRRPDRTAAPTARRRVRAARR